MSSEQNVHVRLRDLSLRAGSLSLLKTANVEFAAGKITLIVGRSGVGKSILLRTIAGILDRRETSIQTSGEVIFHDDENQSLGSRRAVGVVFQDFALLDELSPLENVQLARDHRPHTVDSSDPMTPERVLAELNVPTNVRTAALSGGQRQRLAVARVLAYDPDVVLYDEPTSGLDSVSAGEVARLIQATHADHPRTSLIVTHDFQTLTKIADDIYFFDPATQSLLQVPPESWSQIDELLAEDDAGISLNHTPETTAPLRSLTQWSAHATARFLENSTRACEMCVELPWRLLPLWKRPWWGFRFFLHYFRSVAGPSAGLYIAVAGLIVGFVATHFTFRFLPYASYTKPLLIQDLLRTVGFALYRILVPLLTTILVAARCGAAVASDVGGKKYGQQLDAMRTLGVDPRKYLLTGITYAFLIGTPLLVALSYVTAAFTSLVVFTATHPERGPWFWRLHFHHELVTPGEWIYAGSVWLISKTLISAAGIAAIAYSQGARPKHSSSSVSQGITATILWSTLFVLLVHFVFAFFEFEKYYHG